MTQPDLPDTVTQDQPVSEGGTGAAPWASYLENLPETVRPLVEPAFREWDANTTKRFQSVQSEYEPLKPFKEVVDNGWTYEDVQQALILASTLNDNPQQIYDALAANFGFGQAPTVDQGQGDLEDENDDPRFAKLAELETLQETMAQYLISQQEAQDAAQTDAALDQYMTGLKQQYGDFDEDYVMTKMLNGMSGEDAITQLQSLIGAQQPRTPVPTIMGTGGGLPSQVINPATLDEKGRKALIMQVLQAQNTQ